ncbi:NADH-dependent flavin oxidoreductase, Oye family [Syntrophotalea carbinolica DSM 2380]|uniref:NADH-dependent flavin oxidoreductase, Oye family n=1 Tax=Syntrophotalea carbinolica (strain DSM 2380 / NBRC 103641 / GraBd1) TaxID=338963 RepID=Q3A8G0_SYNC1|nr:NADH:flavin oxidoreductase [Syntrophotalea carbinolica]ABA87332.1 NADH-dependent flavin oxidoreductase, Oye family [Syntrophotalea carbinolica DSM 2380]
MSKLFSPAVIGGMALRNRTVRSATWEGMAADDGAATPELIDLMASLARNDVGLVITGHAFVSSEGQAGPWQLGVHDDSMLEGLTAMAGAVHAQGGRIALQIAHAGCYGAHELSGQEAMGPSAMDGSKAPVCHAMTAADIRRVVEAFAAAALRAKKAGFDAVQIHAAHGYLLSEFLSPYFNQRTDEYGGPVENRAKLVLEVLQAVRKAVGPDYPVLIKLNSEDFVEGGVTVEDMLKVAERLQQAGIDAVEMSGGTIYASGDMSSLRPGRLDTPDTEVFYRKAAELFKQRLTVPLILVGGILSYEVAETLLTEGTADFIALCRSLIREPDLIRRWHRGDRSKARCLLCNGCLGPIMQGRGPLCILDNRGSDTGGKDSGA